MKKLFNIKSRKLILLFLGVLVSVPRFIFATSHTTGGTGGGGGGNFPNPIPRVGTFMDFVKAILEVVLKIGIPVAALAIVYSGFLFVKAQGNETELVKAKKAITYTLIGTAILLGSWLLATGIESTINSLS